MKNCVIPVILIILILFTSCSGGKILNINSFTDKFNAISNFELIRTDLVSVETKEHTESYYNFPEDNITVLIIHNDFSEIESVSVISSEISEKYTQVIKDVIAAIDEGCLNETDLILEEKENEYVNKSHTQNDISLYFTKTKAGCIFTISYNEKIPYSETVSPETCSELTQN